MYNNILSAHILLQARNEIIIFPRPRGAALDVCVRAGLQITQGSICSCERAVCVCSPSVCIMRAVRVSV